MCKIPSWPLVKKSVSFHLSSECNKRSPTCCTTFIDIGGPAPAVIITTSCCVVILSVNSTCNQIYHLPHESRTSREKKNERERVTRRGFYVVEFVLVAPRTHHTAHTFTLAARVKKRASKVKTPVWNLDSVSRKCDKSFLAHHTRSRRHCAKSSPRSLNRNASN